MRKFLGYTMTIGGLLMLIWNAYACLSHSTLNRLPMISAFMLCLFGAALLRKSKANE